MSINLLPWREERKQIRKKYFMFLLVSTIAFALIMLLIINIFFKNKINFQKSRNIYLENQIGALNRKIKEIRDLKIKKKELLLRLKVIQGLQGNRPLIVRVFDSLVRLVPKGVYLTMFEKKDNIIKIRGIANTNNSISDFMRRLDQSVLFESPNLIAVKALDEGLGSKFNLNVEQIMEFPDSENLP